VNSADEERGGAASAASKPSDTAGNAPPGRVLIIDDDEMLCEVMELTLARRGLEITWRTSAQDALDLVRAEDFDVILTDLTMTPMGGIELCERILALRPEVPVIVVSGRADDAAAAAAARAGAHEFLVKPVDATRLRLTISRAIEHKRRATR
jgi:two-component system response regulator HydG